MSLCYSRQSVFFVGHKTHKALLQVTVATKLMLKEPNPFLMLIIGLILANVIFRKGLGLF